MRHGLTPVAVLYRDGVAARIDHLGPPAQIVGRAAAVELQACEVVLDQRLDALRDGEVEECFVSEVVLGAVAVVHIPGVAQEIFHVPLV